MNTDGAGDGRRWFLSQMGRGWLCPARRRRRALRAYGRFAPSRGPQRRPRKRAHRSRFRVRPSAPPGAVRRCRRVANGWGIMMGHRSCALESGICRSRGQPALRSPCSCNAGEAGSARGAADAGSAGHRNIQPADLQAGPRIVSGSRLVPRRTANLAASVSERETLHAEWLA